MNPFMELPLELQYEIYSRVPAIELPKLFQTDRYFASLSSDFWRYRAYRDFGITADVFNDTLLSPNLRYLQLLSTVGDKCVPGSERFVNDINLCFRRTARDYDLDSWNYFFA